MDNDDHMYALELLAVASAELHSRAITLNFAEVGEDESDDFTLANAVIAQFLLK